MVKCKIANCQKDALFGFETDNKAIRCSSHKEQDMCNIKLKNRKDKCQCGKAPIYGYKNEKPIFCSTCRDINDPNIQYIFAKKCEKCDKIGYYTILGSDLYYCIDHKEDDMINYKKKHLLLRETLICGICNTKYNEKKYKINETDEHYRCYLCYLKSKPKKGYCCLCNKRATFGINEATHCKTHIQPDMVDLKNTKRQCKCSSELSMLYGYLGDTKPSRCRICKTSDMIDIHNYNTRCKCSEKLIAIYGFEKDTKASCCKYCKKDGMINIRDPICNNREGLCTQQGNKKYRGYCTYCFSHLFQDDPLTLTIRQKTKELHIRDFINENYEEFIHDKAIYLGDGCNCTNKRRIDFRKIIGNTMLAIEVDEFQHKHYDKNDEISRYNDMYMVFSGKWYYIRYNPDTYKDKSGKIRNPDMQTRLSKLQNTIDNAIYNIIHEKNKELLEIEYIYYNE